MNAYTPQALQALIAEKFANAPGLITPYGYPNTFTGIAPGVTQTAQISISANADFLLLGIAYHANIATAAQNIGNKTVAQCRLLITDSGSNEQFWNSAVDLENIAQNGQDDRSVYFPRFLAGRTSLQLSLTNYSATETYNVELFLNGTLFRAYRSQG